MVNSDSAKPSFLLQLLITILALAIKATTLVLIETRVISHVKTTIIAAKDSVL